MANNGFSGEITSEYASQLNLVEKKIWDGGTGGAWVSANETFTPKIRLQDCLQGWMLEWQGYRNGKPTDGDYTYMLIPKTHALLHNGKVMPVLVVDEGGGIFRKILYVSDTSIKGHSNNAVLPQTNAVLMAIYAY
ncbi:hypothetical protein [Enterococcus sp. DIV0788_1]